jgi:hypothetical protein
MAAATTTIAPPIKIKAPVPHPVKIALNRLQE